jgi:hypothetical protein
MTERKSSFVNVDELMPRVSLEQVATYYGVELPELRQVGAETRTRCFLTCGRSGETGDRVLAIQPQHPAKQWACHHYGCNKSGNLVSLCDLLKPGAQAGGRPRGERFKEIAADLLAIAEGRLPVPALAPQNPVAPTASHPVSPVNVPLKDSSNERARGLLTLDAKFQTDIEAMGPRASVYFRRRAFLTPEVSRNWRMGYLPRDVGGEDKSGGTMRGKVVYGYANAEGDILTWFGRDPEFEEKHEKWEAAGKSEREPEKFHFVKGFHRGQELFGLDHFLDDANVEKIAQLGVVLVEGPNDVIRLDTLGVPALGLCSNAITREQAAKAAAIARELSGGIVTVLLDCDPEGEAGMKQCLGYLAQLTPVRLGWTSKMYGGQFAGRQPESLTLEEWQTISAFLQSGQPVGWSLT